MAVALEDRDIIALQESHLSDNGPGPLPSGIHDQVCRYPVSFVSTAAMRQALDPFYQIILEFGGVADTTLAGDAVLKGGAWLAHARAAD